MAGRPPRELTPSELRQVQALAEMDERDFRQDLLHYLRNPDPSARRIFRHLDVVERTHETAGHIMTIAQQRQITADTPAAKAQAQAMEQFAAAELRATSSLVKRLRMQQADLGGRRWAERVLGEVFWEHLRFLENLHAERVGADEAKQRLQDVLAADEGFTKFKRRDRAAQLLGRMLREERDEVARLLGEDVQPREALAVAEDMLRRRYGGEKGEGHPG